MLKELGIVSILLSVVVVGVFGYFTVIFIQRKWQLRKFPGPFALPLIEIAMIHKHWYS
jgi:hypothetical protein